MLKLARLFCSYFSLFGLGLDLLLKMEGSFRAAIAYNHHTGGQETITEETVMTTKMVTEQWNN
jgi:hypothetical protein